MKYLPLLSHKKPIYTDHLPPVQLRNTRLRHQLSHWTAGACSGTKWPALARLHDPMVLSMCIGVWAFPMLFVSLIVRFSLECWINAENSTFWVRSVSFVHSQVLGSSITNIVIVNLLSRYGWHGSGDSDIVVARLQKLGHNKTVSCSHQNYYITSSPTHIHPPRHTLPVKKIKNIMITNKLNNYKEVVKIGC